MTARRRARTSRRARSRSAGRRRARTTGGSHGPSMVLKRPRKVRAGTARDPVPCRDGGRADPGGAAGGAAGRGRPRRIAVVVACGAEEIVRVDGPGGVRPARPARARAGGPGSSPTTSGATSSRCAPGPRGSPPAVSVPDALFIRFAAYAEIDRRDGRVPGSGRAGPARRAPRGGARRARVARRAAVGARAVDDRASTRPEFEAGVRTIVEHIEAGDCYQVNLTRRLTCDRAADPVALGARSRPATRRRTRSFLRTGGRDRASISPSSPRRPSASSRVDGRAGRDPPDQGHRRLAGPAARRARRTGPRT